MAIKALHPGKEFTHILSWDKRPAKIEPTDQNPEPDNSAHDEYQPTKWPLRVLDSRVRGVLKDKATKVTINPAATQADEQIGTDIRTNEYYFKIVQLGLEAAPSNFDAPVEFKTEKTFVAGKSRVQVVAEYVECIPDDAIAELAETILEGNTLSADEGNVSA